MKTDFSKAIRVLAIALFCIYKDAFAVSVITNTASVDYISPEAVPFSVQSNTVVTTLISDPTPSTIKLYRYFPGSGTSHMAEATQCFNGTSFVNAPAPVNRGTPINTSSAVPLQATNVFRNQEAMVVGVTDLNRNIDPLIRDSVTVEIKTSNGDHERLELFESGLDTGFFVGTINTRLAPPVLKTFDCSLTIETGVDVDINYEDSIFPGDISTAHILVDPFGVVFDSTNGKLVDGVRVSIVNAVNGLPATVFDDDGVTPYPSTMISGGKVTSGPNTYQLPEGGYRFPLMAPGLYRLVVSEVPSNYKWPTEVSEANLNALSNNGFPFAINDGYDGTNFTIQSGPPLNIDLPIDPTFTDLILTKTSIKNEVSLGDFNKYDINLKNIGLIASNDVVLHDKLPLGFRYQKGSLRVNGLKAGNPTISSDGRDLEIPLGTIAAQGEFTVSYVTEVTAGAVMGTATNYAHATRATGLPSNTDQVSVTVKSAFFNTHATIIGQLLEVDNCQFDIQADSVSIQGVPKVKILMEDGTYVVTDKEGRFHFQKVTPGTHVVQIDQSTLPKNLELVPCDVNTRFAGRDNSQFVDVQGGTLWRTDFYVRQKKESTSAVDYRFDGEVMRSDGEVDLTHISYTMTVEAKEDIKDLKISIHVPPMLELLPMTANWNGAKFGERLEGDRFVFLLDGMARGEKGKLIVKAKKKEGATLLSNTCLLDEYRSDMRMNFNSGEKASMSAVTAQTPTCTLPQVSWQEDYYEDKKSIGDEVVEDDITAAGGNRNWLENQAPGLELLFPAEDYNPRAPSTRVVMKHELGQTVKLKVNGEDVGDRYVGNYVFNKEKTINIKEYKGVPLVEGPNLIEASVIDVSGNLVRTISRNLHFANVPDKIIYMPDMSKLIANGIDRPRIVVKLLDKHGKPIRKGVRGTFKINAPYVSAQFEDYSQKRQLSALEKFEPEYYVYTDDGLAFIELAATETAGEVRLELFLENQKDTVINAWLAPAVEDWIVVGFAEGTAGYSFLSGKAELIPGDAKHHSLDVDKQTKFYARGRVKGEWIMTLAFDSSKERKKKQDDFKGIIDPNEFYTLYGDGTTQKNDSTSSEKVYIKLERSRFYALFGDFDTALNETELMRYNRSFTGIKSEYSGQFLGFKIFGAEQDSNYFKEEIQGRGESFMYRLARGGILVNSEKIRLEVRDRFRSDKIIKTETFSRHIDYQIDYSSGTINFKQRIDSFVDFNPQFIIVEYEVLNLEKDGESYGGRVETKFFNDKVKVGFTHINESLDDKTAKLQGVDVRLKVADQSEVILEGAETNSELDPAALQARAYRAEIETRTKILDVNTYAKKTETNFGLGQQAVSESGSFKAGAKTSLHLTEKLDHNMGYTHTKQLLTDDVQNVANTELKYEHSKGSLALGVQRIDELRAEEELEANQATANITHRVFKNKLELQLNVEQNLGSDQSADYPDRYLVQAKYSLTEATKIFLAQEYSNGKAFEGFTTRLGVESDAWTGAKLSSTVNQSISESGPRTYSTMGLAQTLPINEKLTVDGAVDISQTLRESEKKITPINPSQPATSGGILSGNGQFTEDYILSSVGFTYRAEPWTWNMRAENRAGDIEDKTGATTNLIRELKKGVTLATSHSYFVSDFEGGAAGELYVGDLSWAYRPLDSRWSILNRLKYRYETVDNAQSLPIFGQTTLKGADDLTSSAVVNNFNLNRLSLSRKNQFSLYYGAKMAWDEYDSESYKAFIDLWALEIRQDIGQKWDVGLQGSMLHSWTADNFQYSYGPSIGWTPMTNSWISVGYNFEGFQDRDFDAARYTNEGIYLKIRVKFDEKSLGLNKK